MTTWVGAPIVMPSIDVMYSWSQSRWMPASRNRSASRVPSHRALLINGPPTTFETQHSVIQRSIIGRASRSLYVRVIGRSTMPWMRNCQSCGRICGTLSAVSIR